MVHLSASLMEKTIWDAFRDIERYDVLGSFQLAYKFRIIYI